MAAPTHLQDEEHGSGDGQRQDVVGVGHRQVWEPQNSSGLQTGHRKVRHLPQRHEEGDEDGSLEVKQRRHEGRDQKGWNFYIPVSV